jgi:predicted P-loop ATPase
MPSPLDAPVSVFAGVRTTVPVEQLPLAAMLARIQDGTYQPEIDALRALQAQDAEAYRKQKTFLYGFTPAGDFTRRANAKLTTPSALVHFDFDHPPDLTEAKARLVEDPWIAYAFVSPSGDGLKVAVWADGIVDDRSYKHAWGTVLAYFERTYPDLAVANDKACKDIARLCFVSHDPELYQNPDARLYAVSPYQAPAPKPKPTRTARPQAQSIGAGEQARVEDALQVIPADDYDTWLRVGMALHASGEAWARAAWDTWSQRSDKYDAAVQDAKWESFTPNGGVNLATVFHLAQQYGYTPARPSMTGGQRQPPGAPPAPVDMTPWPDQDAGATPQPARPAVPLLLNKNDTPKGALGNILSVLTHDPCWQGVLGYNALSDEVTFLRCPPCYEASGDWKPRALEDHDDAEIANWLQWNYVIFTATSTVHEAVQAAAHRLTYHPIRDYLCSLAWDKTTRLDTWLTTYCGVEDTPYTRAVARTTLLGAVSRVERPGSKVDTAPVLIGPQGIGKSTTWRVLCGDAWFSDTLPDLHDKDAMQALRGKWIIELGELATLHRSEVEVIKRYLSATQDHYRPSYGRRARTFLRQNIFVGSTNKSDIFKDETGNRRFYPITTTGTCDIGALTAVRDQLWAEALHRYLRGEAWHLDGAMAAVAATVQAEHMEIDPWEEPVLAYATDFAEKVKITTTEVMQQAFHWENPALWTPAACKRIGAILRQDGWRPVKRYAHEATPTLPKTTPDPQAPYRRVAAFEKLPSPLRNTDDTDDDKGNGTSVSPGDPHEIRRNTDNTDNTDTFTHVRNNADTGEDSAGSTHISPFSSLYREGPVSSVLSVFDRINTSAKRDTDASGLSVSSVSSVSQLPLPTVGDLVIPLAADGSQIPANGVPFPYLIIAIEDGPDGQQYALFMECAGGWPLAQCQPAPVGQLTDIDIEKDA